MFLQLHLTDQWAYKKGGNEGPDRTWVPKIVEEDCKGETQY